MRLRRALDSAAARDWLDRDRGGHRFYFGRYTGQTPVSGAARVERELQTAAPSFAARRSAADRAPASSTKDRVADSKRLLRPALDGAEMRSRWDMQAHPPDILITNYSMLNVMLQRERDQRRSSSGPRVAGRRPAAHVFTLVVDELHMYRGTAGTEVAYLLRNLLHRLGLRERPEQVRFSPRAHRWRPSATTSSSRSSSRAPARLASRSSTGSTRRARPARSLDEHMPSARALLADDLPAEVARGRSDAQAGDALLERVPRQTASLRRAPAPTSPTRCFRSRRADARRQRCDGLLPRTRALARRGRRPRMRAHLFFRSVPGVWACSDPTCARVAGDFAAMSRDGRAAVRAAAVPLRVRRAGARPPLLPDVRRGCSSAASRREPMRKTAAWFLFPTSPTSRRSRSGPGSTATRRTTRLLAAARRPALTTPTGQRGHMASYALRVPAEPSGARAPAASSTQPRLHGLVASTSRRAAGGASRSIPASRPLPQLRRRLGAGQRSETRPSVEDRRRCARRSARMGTGFEKINQVLGDALLRELGDQRKLVVFSDSRQDAAKLSAGLEKAHYQDLVRQLLVDGELGAERGSRRSTLFEACRAGRTRAEAVDDAATRSASATQRRWPRWLSDRRGGDALTTSERRLRRSRSRAHVQAVRTLERPVASACEPTLLALGINPGGPDHTLQRSAQAQDRATLDRPLSTGATRPPRSAERRTRRRTASACSTSIGAPARGGACRRSSAARGATSSRSGSRYVSARPDAHPRGRRRCPKSFSRRAARTRAHPRPAAGASRAERGERAPPPPSCRRLLGSRGRTAGRRRRRSAAADRSGWRDAAAERVPASGRRPSAVLAPRQPRRGVCPRCGRQPPARRRPVSAPTAASGARPRRRRSRSSRRLLRVPRDAGRRAVPAALRGAHRADRPRRRAGRGRRGSRTSSSTGRESARRRDRPAQRHDDDGGRRRHRRAAAP